MIRLAVPSIEEDDLLAVREALASGYLVQGPRVAQFEREVAGYVGAKHAVAVTNCTSALLLALMALEVGAGDRVAVTAYSWPATANAIALCGAEPVFVDVDPETFNMSPSSLEEALKRERVKAVLPVHAFGCMADMPQILAAAKRHGLPVVEDAACALGAELDGRRAGAWGVMGCFSFHPRKAITTGEGGMIATDDDALARRLRALRNHGQDPEVASPDFIMPGHNMRLTEFQAALGSSQLGKIERIIERRRAHASLYDALLAGTVLRSPRALAGSRHVYQSYVISLPPEVAPHRAAIISTLRERGIETTIGTYHMPLTSYFRRWGDFKPGDFPATDGVSARAMSLPMYEGLSPEQQASVVAALEEAVSLKRASLE